MTREKLKEWGYALLLVPGIVVVPIVVSRLWGDNFGLVVLGIYIGHVGTAVYHFGKTHGSGA